MSDSQTKSSAARIEPIDDGADPATKNAAADIAVPETDLPADAADLSADDNITQFPKTEQINHLRMIEALLFASASPLDETALAKRLPAGIDIAGLLAELEELYAGRGINLVRVAGKWGFRTSEDLSFLMRREAVEQKRLSRAALETLSIIAYHQPVTRSEIEEIRGVTTSKGTLDILMEIGWIKLRGRRRSPGRPVTYGTNDAFLEHFALDKVSDLPGLVELKGAGLLSNNLPSGFTVPEPNDGDDLTEDEDPLEDDGEELEPPLEMHLPEEGDDGPT